MLVHTPSHLRTHVPTYPRVLSGGTGKTNVGGPSSSFGIWHELAPECAAVAQEHNLKVLAVLCVGVWVSTCMPTSHTHTLKHTHPHTSTHLHTPKQVVRIHTHIGSGSDPAVWQKTAGMSIDLCRGFPDVVTLNLGGGYKVARMATDKFTDLQECGAPVKETFESFAKNFRLHAKVDGDPRL